MSAILSSDDLNDFISPGVACIKPVETLPKQEGYDPYEVTTEDKVQPANPAPASISLTDCLACSGCVTSAEAVLVSLQSHTEVLNTLDEHPELKIPSLASNHSANGHASPRPNARVFVASVSPQVRASIAATFGISDQRAGFMIEQFLSGSQGLRIGGQHHSGFQWVVDTNRMREACLVLGAEEVSAALADKSKVKPLLTSACPGWICYAEKTHPHILPHLSALKSPQALSGTLLKSVLSKALNIAPSQIWHLAIMPCFDKKLEASREELTDMSWYNSTSTSPIRDVDCVITSRELLSLAEARGIQLSALPQQSVVQTDPTHFPDHRIYNFLFPKPRQRAHTALEAGPSGGYLYHILQTQQSLHPRSTLSIRQGRNSDVVEYILNSPDSTPIFKAARYYGFRNIQNLVRKLKPAKVSKLPGASKRTPASAGGMEYSYVEVMACPGGCTNGGGQIKVEDVASIIPDTRGEVVDQETAAKGQGQKEWLRRVDEAYYSAEDSDSDYNDDDTIMTNGGDTAAAATNGVNGTHHLVNGIDVAAVKDVLAYWSSFVDVSLEKLAYTTFRKVESDVGKTKNMSDTQRIAAVAGMSGGGW
jgi:iron only hydrogenase large subunit-like protein